MEIKLQKVSVNFTQASPGPATTWKEPFNQATFFNYDTVNPVIIGKVGRIAAAQIIGGQTFPTLFEISLNAGEINTTEFLIDFKNSTTANLVIIYTQYLGVE